MYILSWKQETNAVVRKVTSVTMINAGVKVIIYLYIIVETRNIHKRLMVCFLCNIGTANNVYLVHL